MIDRGKVIRSALRLAAHNWDDEADPGWQRDLEEEIFDNEIKTLAQQLEKENK